MIITDPLPNWVEPRQFRDWGNKWSPPIKRAWLSHISENLHPDEVVAVGRLLFPKFIEHERGVFLDLKFDLQTFGTWMDELGDIHAVERMMNLTHVYDLFSESMDVADESYLAVANLIADAWKFSLFQCFPGREFEVSVSNSDQDYGPTVGLLSLTA